jgi:hypothetical protein
MISCLAVLSNVHCPLYTPISRPYLYDPHPFLAHGTNGKAGPRIIHPESVVVHNQLRRRHGSALVAHLVVRLAWCCVPPGYICYSRDYHFLVSRDIDHYLQYVAFHAQGLGSGPSADVAEELVVKGILFDSPKYESASEIPIPALEGEDISSEEKKEPAASTANGRVSGWLIVRRQYKPSKEGILFTNATTDLTGAQAQKRQEKKLSEDTASIRSGREGEDDDPKLDADAASTMTIDSGSGSVNSNKAGAASTASQRSWVQAARQTLTLPKREAPAKERFYCVLKGSVLYLYEDEKQSDALAVLAVDRFNVTIETSGGRFNGKDGEMFAKKNAIVMRLWQGEKDSVHKGTSMPVLAKGMTGEVDRTHEGNNDMEKAPWYLMSKNNSQ